jgi:magnesium transporter
MPLEKDHLTEPVLTEARLDFVTLPQDITIGEALEQIRKEGVGEKIVYFYVVDDEERLVGVLPTRRLLIEMPDRLISESMIKGVVSLPSTATVFDACELFVMYKFLALPVVDPEGRIAGIVDISLLSEEIFDLADREQAEALFEGVGFRISQVKDASPLRAFRFRFPWLLATIASGTMCALLASIYEATLAESLVLAFFLTLVLGLGESVSIQSMTITIQSLRATRPTLRWYRKAMARELGTAVLLGLGCGLVVGMIVWGWRGEGLAAVTIGVSILLSLTAACTFGLSVPAMLHAFKLDPKIAAGPITLATADVSTLLIYLSLATWWL